MKDKILPVAIGSSWCLELTITMTSGMNSFIMNYLNKNCEFNSSGITLITAYLLWCYL